jgi:hypothetical protein
MFQKPDDFLNSEPNPTQTEPNPKELEPVATLFQIHYLKQKFLFQKQDSNQSLFSIT